MLSTLAHASVLAAPAADEDKGWSRLVALLLTVGVFYLGVTIHQRWKALKSDPSSTDGQKSLDTVKPQVNGDSDSNDSDLPEGGEVVPLRAKRVEQFVAERVDKKPTTQVVREAAQHTGASESTVWRTVRRLRGNRGGTA